MCQQHLLENNGYEPFVELWTIRIMDSHPARRQILLPKERYGRQEIDGNCNKGEYHCNGTTTRTF